MHLVELFAQAARLEQRGSIAACKKLEQLRHRQSEEHHVEDLTLAIAIPCPENTRIGNIRNSIKFDMKIQIGNMYGSILRIAILNSELNKAQKLAGKKRMKLSNFSHNAINCLHVFVYSESNILEPREPAQIPSEILVCMILGL